MYVIAENLNWTTKAAETLFDFIGKNEANGQEFESFNNCLDLGSTKLIGINIT